MCRGMGEVKGRSLIALASGNGKGAGEDTKRKMKVGVGWLVNWLGMVKMQGEAVRAGKAGGWLAGWLEGSGGETGRDMGGRDLGEGNWFVVWLVGCMVLRRQ